MVEKVSKARLIVGDSGGDREVNDFYATQPKSVEALFNIHDFGSDLFKMSVLEPCCGMGHISEVLKTKFKKVTSTDLIYRGYGKKKSIDFLTKNYGDKKFDWVITNPPFKYAQGFIEKALSICNVGVAMFLKVQFLESKNRYDFFKNNKLKWFYPFSERQPAFKYGLSLNPKDGKPWSSMAFYAWYVWEKDYEGDIVCRHIPPTTNNKKDK